MFDLEKNEHSTSPHPIRIKNGEWIMDIPVSLRGFEGRNLFVRTPGALSNAQLFIDGTRAQKQGRSYNLRDNEGRQVEIKVKQNFFDPIPKLQIGNELVILAEPLKWYEYVWIALPLVLVALGGALGGATGGIAAYGNSRVFRSNQSTVAKYLICGFITAGSITMFLVLAGLLQLLILGR